MLICFAVEYFEIFGSQPYLASHVTRVGKKKRKKIKENSTLYNVGH